MYNTATSKSSARLFSFERFSKVFSYDLQKVHQNYGLTFLILVLLPLLFPFLYAACSMVIFGAGWKVPENIGRVMMAIVSVSVLMLTFAPNVFGKLTEKSYGSEFITLPASSFEKFVSMVLVTVVVSPLAFVLCYLTADAIAVGIGLSEGKTLLTLISDSMVIDEDGFRMHVGLILMLSLTVNSLEFLLGSIYFSKFKIGKTLLVVCAIKIIFSFMTVPLISLLIGSPDMFTLHGEDMSNWLQQHIDHIGFYVNLVVDLTYIVDYSVLLGLLYWRIRTIKH